MFLTTIYVSKYNQNLTPRLIVMFVIAIIVRTSEYTNAYASQHWQTFCTQNYFDPKGVFMSIMIAGPLLLNSFILLCFFLREASTLLIQVKQVQIRKQRRRQQQRQEAVESSNAKTSIGDHASKSNVALKSETKKDL
jgi:transmembrane protein 18